jgi:hypothetical protein
MRKDGGGRYYPTEHKHGQIQKSAEKREKKAKERKEEKGPLAQGNYGLVTI